MSTILGIHSSVSKSVSSSNPVKYVTSTEGHAWISIRYFGNLSTYSLYPDNHAGIRKSGRDVTSKGSDIRKNFEIEQRKRSEESRYYFLTTRQYSQLMGIVRRNTKHRLTENCASWAAETVRKVTGDKIKADEKILRFIESPRQLSRHIVKLENLRNTSIDNPLQPADLMKRPR